MIKDSFLALVVRADGEYRYSRTLETRTVDELPAGDVLVRVRYSSLNYKDALSATGNRGVTRKYPHTPGIDAAGCVAASDNPAFAAGDQVIVSGFDLGMNTPGGFGRYIRVPSEWVMPRPRGLDLQQCMQIGTAGFTAAQCIDALLAAGCDPGSGPVLVTGSTGGVGSFAVALLAGLGFQVTAATGKSREHAFLARLGAVNFLDRQQVSRGQDRMLLRERWAGVVDTVGGTILATAVKSARYGGVVTACGNAASGDLPLNVYPFILRAVRLVGIDSARCPMEKRKEIWERLDNEWRVSHLHAMGMTVPLAELDQWIDRMLAGEIRGRIVVDLGEDADEH